MRYAIPTMLFAMASAVSAIAQVSLDWHTVDGGGTMFSTSREIRLGGTLGQPDAGPTMTGRGIELTGGFWVAGLPTGQTCIGDLNGDGEISLNDLTMLLSNFGCMANCTADLTGDGQVSIADLALLLAHFGTQCP